MGTIIGLITADTRRFDDSSYGKGFCLQWLDFRDSTYSVLYQAEMKMARCLLKQQRHF